MARTSSRPRPASGAPYGRLIHAFYRKTSFIVEEHFFYEKARFLYRIVWNERKKVEESE